MGIIKIKYKYKIKKTDRLNVFSVLDISRFSISRFCSAEAASKQGENTNRFVSKLAALKIIMIKAGDFN